MSGLWLIGFRGAGKTTVGQALASRLGRRFLDCDHEWEKTHGQSILAFVEKEGLEAFRRSEQVQLEACAAEVRLGAIVATGGGFVEWPGSLAVLEGSPAPKVFLDLPADALWERLSKHPERLKIGHLSSIQSLRTLLENRRPFYEKIATFTWKNQDISECLPALESLLD